MKQQLVNVQTNLKNVSSSGSCQLDGFSRYKQTNFLELLKTHEETENFCQSSDLDKRLYDEFNVTNNTERYQQMFKFRQKLPSFEHREEIVDRIKKHQIVLIAGNTGCGTDRSIIFFYIFSQKFCFHASLIRFPA